MPLFTQGIGMGRGEATGGGVWTLQDTMTLSGDTTKTSAALPGKKMWMVCFDLKAVGGPFVVRMQFNSDTDAVYTYTQLSGSAVQSVTTSAMQIGSAAQDEKLSGCYFIDGTMAADGKRLTINGNIYSGEGTLGTGDPSNTIGGQWVEGGTESVIDEITVLRQAGTGTITGTVLIYFNAELA